MSSSGRDNRYRSSREGDHRSSDHHRHRGGGDRSVGGGSSSRNRSNTLFVRNISDRVRYEEIKKLFERHGAVVDITIPLDYYSRVPKGFCFVEYEDARDADDAFYNMGRIKLHGRELEVEFARGERKTPADMRNRDRDKRYYDYRRSSPDDRRRGGGRSRSPDSPSASYHRNRKRSRSKDGVSGRGAALPTRRRYSPSAERSLTPIDSAELKKRSRSRSNYRRGRANSNDRLVAKASLRRSHSSQEADNDSRNSDRPPTPRYDYREDDRSIKNKSPGSSSPR